MEKTKRFGLLNLKSAIGIRNPKLFRSHGDEIPCPLLHLLDLSDELVEVFFSVNKIDFARIDYQKGSLIIVEKIIIVSFGQRLKIL